MQRFNIGSLRKTRSSQKSFHVASERDVRIELREMTAGDSTEGFQYDGSLVLICFDGEFVVYAGGADMQMSAMDQIVTLPNESIRVACRTDGLLEFIWTPAFASTKVARADGGG